MEQALSGVRILGLTHRVARLYCTKMLADYDAEVIKIERPETGDGARTWSQSRGSLWYCSRIVRHAPELLPARP